ncbi:hypothetical protein [Arthrobacter sp. ov118]|uniref:hypothetical protein n=1 Tax=Arthrobacter sp. ov118 TaxID=1761747 RepID=UPI000B02531F
MSRPPVNPEDLPANADDNADANAGGNADGNAGGNADGNAGGNSGGHPAGGPLRSTAGDPAATGRPKAIVVIAVVVALEAAALLVAAGWYGTQLLTGAPVLSFWGAVFTLGLLLAFSVWLFAVARFLMRGFRWPRAGALVAQLFVLTIGFPTLTGGFPLAGLAMLVPAVTTIVLLFDKRVIAFASRAAGSPPAL